MHMKLTKKMGIVGLLSLICIIASLFVYGILSDRQSRFFEAVADISSKWASSQTINGPVLAVPYVVRTKDEKGVVTDVAQFLTISPTRVNASVQVDTDTRSRGIFRVPVYTARIAVTGSFDPSDLNSKKDRKSTRLNSSHVSESRMPSSA